jgi:hypothetical protein
MNQYLTIKIPVEYVALFALLTLSFATCNQVAIDEPEPATVYTIPYDPFAFICRAEHRRDSIASVFDSVVKQVKAERKAELSSKKDTAENTVIVRISPHFGEHNRKK